MLMTIWQKLVWCGLIGGAIGLVFAVYASLQPGPNGQPQDWTVNLITGIVMGSLCGLILLGIPATVWTVGKRIIHGTPQPTAVVSASHPIGHPTSGELKHDAGRWAMAGSTAAVPGAIIGAVLGLALAFLAVTLIGLLSIIGVTWYSEIMKDQKLAWFGIPTLIGAGIGFLCAGFIGSAAGAISGGLRALTRH